MFLRCADCGRMISGRDYAVGEETTQECPARWKSLAEQLDGTVRAGHALYDAIVSRLAPNYPAGSRDLDWDVLPGTLAALARERDEAVLALAAEQGKPEGAPDDRWSVTSRRAGGRPTWCRQAVVQGHVGTLYVEYDPLRMGKGWQWSFSGPTAVSKYQDTTGCRQGMIDANGAEG